MHTFHLRIRSHTHTRLNPHSRTHIGTPYPYPDPYPDPYPCTQNTSFILSTHSHGSAVDSDRFHPEIDPDSGNVSANELKNTDRQTDRQTYRQCVCGAVVKRMFVRLCGCVYSSWTASTQKSIWRQTANEPHSTNT